LHKGREEWLVHVLQVPASVSSRCICVAHAGSSKSLNVTLLDVIVDLSPKMVTCNIEKFVHLTNQFFFFSLLFLISFLIFEFVSFYL
jgi:hypothetical protein